LRATAVQELGAVYLEGFACWLYFLADDPLEEITQICSMEIVFVWLAGLAPVPGVGLSTWQTNKALIAPLAHHQQHTEF
ncbi:hypothetical protein, partial [Lysinibacillus agricola]|uniref:hypothetical protein n=1 Tax=Lysinibacillus agricola TaxID=2590012 RepID=UPI003C20FD12